MGLLFRLSKKVADHLRQIGIGTYRQVEMALSGAISFEMCRKLAVFPPSRGAKHSFGSEKTASADRC